MRKVLFQSEHKYHLREKKFCPDIFCCLDGPSSLLRPSLLLWNNSSPEVHLHLFQHLVFLSGVFYYLLSRSNIMAEKPQQNESGNSANPEPMDLSNGTASNFYAVPSTSGYQGPSAIYQSLPSSGIVSGLEPTLMHNWIIGPASPTVSEDPSTSSAQPSSSTTFSYPVWSSSDGTTDSISARNGNRRVSQVPNLAKSLAKMHL